MVILTTIYVVVAVLLLFASAIFIHEWGHFFVARMCGMKVEEFAIGFGKILWKREKDVRSLHHTNDSCWRFCEATADDYK